MRVVGLTAAFLWPAAAALAQVPAGLEFRVNTYTTGTQGRPAAAALPDGGFVAVWSSDLGSSIAGQLVDAAGSLRGAEFEVATAAAGGAVPAVASDRRGRFVVAWQEPGLSAANRIIARRFDEAGAALDAPFAVNTSTAFVAQSAAVATQPGGAFVVAWSSNGQDGSQWGVRGRRFDGSGQPLGSEFQVNTYTTSDQRRASIASDGSGGFVIVWQSTGQDGSAAGVFGQRFLRDGTRAGAEFQVNGYTTNDQTDPHVLSRPGGEFTVVWPPDTAGDGLLMRRFDASGAPQGSEVRLVTFGPWTYFVTAASMSAAGDLAIAWDERYGFPPMGFNVFGRRFDAAGAPRGQEFLVANFPAGPNDLPFPSIASDASGNLLAAWGTPPAYDILARRYGGLRPAADTLEDGGNGVLEADDTFVLRTRWRNDSGAAQTFEGNASSVVAPGGLSLTLSSALADYGTLANGADGACGTSCIGGTLTGTRAPGHVDASLLERIAPDAQGQTETWILHVGESFTDVPRASPFYRFVETLLHKRITGGCAAEAFCPTNPVTREQLAVFLLLAKEAEGFAPPACVVPAFADVPASSPFCSWIEELARRGVVAGCGGGNYCPDVAVTREQMAVFLLRTLDPALNPPACTVPIFPDVPGSSPFCRWIEELARRGVVTGCAAGLYCPTAAVTREQMSVFLGVTFDLTLYGP